MKSILTFLFVSVLLDACSQNKNIWLPYERVSQISQHKTDSCDFWRKKPFAKIQFTDIEEVSIVGSGTADPYQYHIKKMGKNIWTIVDTIFLGDRIIHAPVKTTLEIKDDTLYLNTTIKNEKVRQKFVQGYGGLNFTDFNESELGNLLIEGKYVIRDNTDTILFRADGNIQVVKNKESSVSIRPWIFSSYKFMVYATNCNPFSYLERIVEFTDINGAKRMYVCKNNNGKIDFYIIKEMKDRWIAAEYCYEFSIVGIGYVKP